MSLKQLDERHSGERQLAREQGVLACPSCGVRSLRCFIREAEIGSWCCGDCTAHHGEHEWEGAK